MAASAQQPEMWGANSDSRQASGYEQAPNHLPGGDFFSPQAIEHSTLVDLEHRPKAEIVLRGVGVTDVYIARFSDNTTLEVNVSEPYNKRSHTVVAGGTAWKTQPQDAHNRRNTRAFLEKGYREVRVGPDWTHKNTSGKKRTTLADSAQRVGQIIAKFVDSDEKVLLHGESRGAMMAPAISCHPDINVAAQLLMAPCNPNKTGSKEAKEIVSQIFPKEIALIGMIALEQATHGSLVDYAKLIVPQHRHHQNSLRIGKDLFSSSPGKLAKLRPMGLPTILGLYVRDNASYKPELWSEKYGHDPAVLLKRLPGGHMALAMDLTRHYYETSLHRLTKATKGGADYSDIDYERVFDARPFYNTPSARHRNLGQRLLRVA